MTERPVTVDVSELDDCDKLLTITMSVNHSTDLDRFIPHITDELQSLSHDTFKQHWNKPEPPQCKGFQWIGQEWSHCAGCGQPYWEHDFIEHPAKGSGPFDGEWEYKLISDASKAHVRAAYPPAKVT